VTVARSGSRARRVREAARVPSLVLLDANVIFDMLLFRAPWHDDAIAIFEAVEDGRLHAVMAPHTVTTLWYVLRRQSSDAIARSAVRRLLSSLPLAPLDGNAMLRALALGVADFEDACQVVAAERAGAEAIVTRDERHFKGSPVPVLTPAHLVARLGAG
jgi:predicted nucleic acid-binding protein